MWSGAAAGGPLFVYCGNEGPVQWFMDNAGWIREIAKEFGALVVGPEVSERAAAWLTGCLADLLPG